MINYYKGSAVIIQARLSSTRLEKKVIMELNNKTILHYVLSAMKALPVEHFILACDIDSKKELELIAEPLGFFCVAGSQNDVLNRFCDAIKITNDKTKEPIQVVVRATADNPFLFIETAIASIKRYYELEEPDYFTFTGLPLGSGIEILKASSLLKANQESTNDYEREHVGPSIYSHQDVYRCVRESAPKEWYFPELRTTVDTLEDYENAKQMIKFLIRKEKQEPFTCQDILEAAKFSNKVVVFVPSVISGQGSGHLHRVCDIALSLLNKLQCLIYIEETNKNNFSQNILKKIPSNIIVSKIPKKTGLIVTDNFKTNREKMMELKNIAPVLAIDEGGNGRAFADYILDILPSLNHFTENDPCENPNLLSPNFIKLPITRNFNILSKISDSNIKAILEPRETSVLVVFGGENASGMALPVANTIASLNFSVSAIDVNLSFEAIKKYDGKIKTFSHIDNLREKLNQWDLVVTHYGLTAFEALAAGCLVILVSPTDYHYELGIRAGFTTINSLAPSQNEFKTVFKKGIKVPKIISPKTKQEDLPSFIKTLASYGKKYSCPICGDAVPYSIVERNNDRTVGLCSKCNMHFLAFIISPPKKYVASYFFDEYKAQYGKTYLDDFNSIRQQGLRRMQIIDSLYKDIYYKKRKYNVFNAEKIILDIGCAYGPFLVAAKQSSWKPVGTDISDSAIKYVQENLKLPAFTSSFPALPNSFDFIYQKKITGTGYDKISISIETGYFSAITMWFVIEHFQDLNSVIKRVNTLLMPGGIFAFSTPNISGVTGKFSRKKFFANSPTDHYSMWDAKTVKVQLEKFGFKVLKIVSIGHHPERFKTLVPLKKDSLRWKMYMLISKIFKLGDSMEIYAMKHGTMDDVQ